MSRQLIANNCSHQAPVPAAPAAAAAPLPRPRPVATRLRALGAGPACDLTPVSTSSRVGVYMRGSMRGFCSVKSKAPLRSSACRLLAVCAQGQESPNYYFASCDWNRLLFQ